MIRISQLEDVQLIRDDPELWREVYGYLCVCISEIQEYADESDLEDHDFNFVIASESDIDYVQALGVPEEEVVVDIRCGPERRQLRRLVFPTEVVFNRRKGCQLDRPSRNGWAVLFEERRYADRCVWCDVQGRVGTGQIA